MMFTSQKDKLVLRYPFRVGTYYPNIEAVESQVQSLSKNCVECKLCIKILLASGPWWWSSCQRGRPLLRQMRSNPAEVYSFNSINCLKRTEVSKKRPGIAPSYPLDNRDYLYLVPPPYHHECNRDEKEVRKRFHC